MLEIMRSVPYNTDHEYRREFDNIIDINSRRDSLIHSISVLKASLRKISAEMDTAAIQERGVASPIMRNETFKDIAGDPPTNVVVSSSQPTDFVPSDYNDISNFLSRPVKIYNAKMFLNARNETSLDPWSLLLATPSIRAKIRNFGLMRANLKIRISFSAMPFHYGRLMVGYVPMATLNSVSNGYISNITSGAQTYASQEKLFYSWLSQFYGSKVLDIKSNKPFEIDIPFVCPAVMARVYSPALTTSLAAGTSYPDFASLGRLVFGNVNVPKANTTTPTDPYITIYAWLEDVVLALPTGSQQVITTEGDEREKGPIEKWTSKMIPYTSALSTVPEIAPWALASGTVLKGINKFASLLGWSYPNRIEPAVRMKPEPFQSGANCIGMDTGKRIVLDPKQEVSVDPRILGVQHDDMHLDALCSIESYLDTFEWTGSSAVLTPLAKYAVNPALSNVISNPYGGTGKVVQPTALAFAAKPFTYWNGKIKFRLEIVCSSFVRGKLLIGFEPNVAQSALINSNLSFNKQSYYVLDIQETDSFSFCVPWMFHLPFANCIDDNTQIETLMTLSSPSALYTSCNGYIFVAPLTELQTPDGSSVEVNVYVSGEEMTFAYPDFAQLPTQKKVFITSEMFIAEMEVEEVEEKKTLNEVEVMCDELIDISMKPNKSLMSCFGESVVSFRSLIKRFTATNSQSVSSISITAPGALQVQIPAFPRKNLKLNGTLNVNVNESNLFDYLADAFLGYRGGIRHRLRVIGAQVNDPNSHVRISLGNASVFTDTYAAAGVSLQSVMSKGLGTAEYIPHTNGGIEFETPYYSTALFHLPNDTSPQNASWYDRKEFLSRIDCFYDIASTLTNATIAIHHEVAGAEDFSYSHFLSSPPYSF